MNHRPEYLIERNLCRVRKIFVVLCMLHKALYVQSYRTSVVFLVEGISWIRGVIHNYNSSVLLLCDSSQLQILEEELSDEVDSCCGF